MQSLPLESPPKRLCMLRLSAVGDISHMLPVVRTIQQSWPDTALTWIIGETEYALVADIPGIEFITFDKTKRWHSYANIRKRMRNRRFGVLLHMQMSMRASLASLLITADIKLGFGRPAAKDFQWLFTNHRIAAGEHKHVIDSLFGFTQALGITERVLRWDIPIPGDAQAFADRQLGGNRQKLVISPCSSMSYRNWSVTGYATLANYAAETYDMNIVLTGGPFATEARYGDAIAAAVRHPVTNLIGKTDLKQLLAVLTRARVVVAPDSGTAHLATAVGVPVIGLYATTNPDRACPYLSAEFVVNKYPEAVMAKYGVPPEKLPWGTRVRDRGTMERISPNDVIRMLDTVLAKQQ
ncbi:MAG: glycosyltransferase family 9 protein [Acidiferrobacterales bacterium]